MAKKRADGIPYPSVAELRERVLAGETVTEDEWMKARMRAELDELRAIADQRAAEQQAAEQRRQRVREIRETLLDAVRAVDDAPDMVAAIRAEMQRSEITREAYRELARLIPERQAVEGVRWLRAAMARGDSVEIDGRLIPISARPGEPVARLIHAACTEVGVSRYLLSPQVQVQAVRRAPTSEEIAELERRRKEAQKRAWRRIADRAAGQDGGSDAA
ncbi:hypothetical protein SAMN04489764_2915 [Thermostaphylospora chromogena]|uniref:Uncharacterized protein n=1 Tax=Thermostaphylospora chromogena TaxID=35622 RepID=A0A1H1FCG6_9ACTN|nr:hypothetical protein SAMN04489764_2915 [Thermostaphylospora chromogena]